MRRFLNWFGGTALLVLVGFGMLRLYVEVMVIRRQFPVEARLLNSKGRVVFVSLRSPAPQKSMDEYASSFAVWNRSHLWINRLILSGDREYAFGPFDRVYVLRAAGIDSSEVETVTRWRGSPHDFPFPTAPTENDYGASVVPMAERPQE